MKHTQPPPHSDQKNSLRHRLLMGLTCILVAYSWGRILWRGLREHAAGHGWMASLGFDRGFFRLFGDMMLPLVLSLLLIRTAKKMPSGRERTVTLWIGWCAFFFLLAWWPWLRMLVSGQSLLP